ASGSPPGATGAWWRSRPAATSRTGPWCACSAARSWCPPRPTSRSGAGSNPAAPCPTQVPADPKEPVMERLAQTEGLTDIQRDILSTVRDFVDKEIIPVATDLEHKDEYPAQIVEGMKELGLFGLTIPEEYGGLGESLLTYALVVEQIARGWMSVSGIVNTHFIVAYMISQHGTAEQKEYFLPKMAADEVRGAFSMSEPGLGSDVSAITTKAVPD